MAVVRMQETAQVDLSNTVEGRYETLSKRRLPFLERAREVSKLTLASLIPQEGHSAHSDFKTPWQGLGARGVNNLSAKLLLTLLPPNSPFFRLRVDEATMARLEQEPGAKTEFDKALGSVERSIMTEIEISAIRVPLSEALRHLIVAGNVLVYFMPDKGMRVYSLDRYVVNRDPEGNPLEVITKEQVHPLTLTDEVRTAVCSEQSTEANFDEHLTLYTKIWRGKSRSGNAVWHTVQEINRVEVPGTRGTYPIDRSPWIALRFNRVDNEDYGRSFVEEFFGDLKSLEALTKAIVEGSAAAAKVLFLVDPNGTTKKDTVSRSPNGAVRAGNNKDVTVLQMEKFNDFRVAQETSRMLTERLSSAFLMNASVQRDAERVTAEEIRYMASELEDALGGVYSILSLEFQLPTVNIFMDRMRKARKLPKFPKVNGKNVVEPMITTGLEALGRGRDLARLRGFIEDLAIVAKAKPELVQRVNGNALIEQMATARGVDTQELFISEEQFAQNQQQQAIMQALQQTIPGAVTAATRNVTSPQAQQAPQQ